ncbi:MAG: putative toxin-antitoxin system toxin component, PIN family [Candidatus Andersenbacteria bacterium RIFCSPHIGHO2_12_FULL_45_11b]|uniref:Putative toxin-antitoxin system toxin component, PIN family n=1 Tax=Candidatus Andersenbacteria bacterium RIFCSPHIGHO2_12_FULL_45_11b TaxID=1797282 RepID=A0A1G1XCK6_9BACT|nr:MAG: putative toxin-antitoxin system toxin component, PIN family [Candidatus Andersenbacteria bacterium RIFCSPHIGHO2_12_FULL_45_11b]
MRVVLDTNVLIDGFNDDFCSEAKLIDSVLSGEMTAVSTQKIINEYRLILRRLIDDRDYRTRLENFFAMLEDVDAEYVDAVIDDEEDMKFLEAAVGGEVDAIVTSDKHLLDVGEVDGVRIITPDEAWRRTEDEAGGAQEWRSLVQGWGINSHDKEA